MWWLVQFGKIEGDLLFLLLLLRWLSLSILLFFLQFLNVALLALKLVILQRGKRMNATHEDVNGLNRV